MLSNKGIYDDYKRLRDDGDIYNWLYIYLQIERNKYYQKTIILYYHVLVID